MTILSSQNSAVLWVCVDCNSTHHGVREDHDHQPDREPLNLIADDEELTAGILWEEHGESCPKRLARDWHTECDCEQQTFSSSPCQGCGSTLGDAREALTIWYPAAGS